MVLIRRKVVGGLDQLVDLRNLSLRKGGPITSAQLLSVGLKCMVLLIIPLVSRKGARNSLPIMIHPYLLI